MASIQLNGETIHLKQQALVDFQKLAQVLYSRLKPEEPIRQTVAGVLFEAVSKSIPHDNPVMQTSLWAMHDLGVQEIRVDLASQRVDLDKVSETESSRGDARALAVAAIESGRAYIAALANVQQRVVRINGQIVRAFPQPKDEVEKMIRQIQANRLVNEDLVVTAVRGIGALLKAGKSVEDAEYRAAVEVAAGLGVLDLVIDIENSRLGIGAFSESNAAAMALLQGGTAKQIQQVRERIQKLVEKLEEARKEAAKNAPVAPAQAQRVSIPAVIGSPRSVRRRG
ncbi:MAG: hypothetical protein U0572_07590 [Phycisphaerales bacterium]